MNKRTISNASWIIGCRIIQALLNLFVGMLSARFLGPANYGLLNYAASIVGFVAPLMRLGLNATLVHEITENEQNEGEILGTALGLTIPSGILSVCAIFVFVSVVNSNDTDAIIVCSIYSLSLLFQAAEMITYWYQAKLMSKYSSLSMVASYIIVSAYKIYILTSAKSVYWFAIANVIDHLLICVILLTIYHRIAKFRLRFSFKFARRMLSKSKYYIISGMMVTVFQQTDKMMLKNMIGDEVTGWYSAAITCAGIFGFVYAALIDSMRPEILKSRSVSKEKYKNDISCAYSIIFYVSLMQSIFTTIFARPIIFILYGEYYLPAVPALRVAVWYVTYSYFGVIRGIWILGEGKHKSVIWIDTVGAILNIILNLLLIPRYNLLGAAVATVITQFIMNFVLGFFIKGLRENGKLMLKGLNPKLFFRVMTQIIERERRDN